MILQNRVKESNKIRIMRQLKAQETSDTDNEMQDLRTKMQKQLKQSYKKGDMGFCAPSNPEAKKVAYCNKWFFTDPD